MEQTGDSDPFGYVLGMITSSGCARTWKPLVIRGDPKDFQQVHQTLPFARKDTRLALSYHLDDVPTEAEIMGDIDLIERIAFPGFDEKDFLSSWVRHGQEKHGAIRQDIHGVLLRQDLVSGKAYNPYCHQVDLVRFDKAKQLVNIVRGYSEPAAPEHSRVYGYTAPGTLVHELELVVKELCASQGIDNQDDLARALEERGYRPKRRKNGSLSGRKSITVINPNGEVVKLIGSPFARVQPRLVSWSQDSRLEQAEKLIAELNRMCIRRAERNRKLYGKKVRKEIQEKQPPREFKFHPITLQELLTPYIYESPPKRARSPLIAVPGVNQGPIPSSLRANGPGSGWHGSSGSTHLPAGTAPENPIDVAQRATGRRLKQAIGRAGKFIKEVRTALINDAIAKSNRRVKGRRSQESERNLNG